MDPDTVGTPVMCVLKKNTSTVYSCNYSDNQHKPYAVNVAMLANSAKQEASPCIYGVCLKIRYTPKNGYVIGMIMTNQWILGYPTFRQTHGCSEHCQLVTCFGSGGRNNPHDYFVFHHLKKIGYNPSFSKQVQSNYSLSYKRLQNPGRNVSNYFWDSLICATDLGEALSTCGSCGAQELNAPLFATMVR